MPKRMISVRLSDTARSLLADRARQLGISQAAVVEQALRAWEPPGQASQREAEKKSRKSRVVY